MFWDDLPRLQTSFDGMNYQHLRSQGLFLCNAWMILWTAFWTSNSRIASPDSLCRRLRRPGPRCKLTLQWSHSHYDSVHMQSSWTARCAGCSRRYFRTDCCLVRWRIRSAGRCCMTPCSGAQAQTCFHFRMRKFCAVFSTVSTIYRLPIVRTIFLIH